MGVSRRSEARLHSPGKAVESGFVESFNGRLGDECLNTSQFLSIDYARCKIEAWRHDYNHRSHSSLGHLTPNEDFRRGQQRISEAADF